MKRMRVGVATSRQQAACNGNSGGVQQLVASSNDSNGSSCIEVLAFGLP